ncbi:MAG: hypothetical protein NVS9B14_23260 [Candidatus Acidiferrum sp.]
MMAWVTDVPNFNGRSVSLPFRFLTAMQGALAVGSNLNHWQQEDFALAEKMIAYYKSVRATVQNGLLYRLTPPRTTISKRPNTSHPTNPSPSSLPSCIRNNSAATCHRFRSAASTNPPPTPSPGLTAPTAKPSPCSQPNSAAPI